MWKGGRGERGDHVYVCLTDDIIVSKQHTRVAVDIPGTATGW